MVVVIFLIVQSTTGDAYYAQRNVIKLTEDFQGDEADEDVEGSSFMLILDHLE